MVEAIILPSARKHNVDDADMRAVVRNPQWSFPMGESTTMFVGFDRAARPIEVGVADTDHGPVIFHANVLTKSYAKKMR